MTMTARRTQTIEVSDLENKRRDAIVTMLNQNLANLTNLAIDYKQAHWNVTGKDFYQLHKMLDKFDEQTREFADLCAERATAIGGVAHGTLQATARDSELPVFPENERGEEALLRHLIAGIEKVNETLAKSIEDTDDEQRSQDVFIEVARGIEKQRWMLTAHLC